jgi:hypothetical protein
LLVHLLPLPSGMRKFNLLVASYPFSAAWNAQFVPLVMFLPLALPGLVNVHTRPRRFRRIHRF